MNYNEILEHKISILKKLRMNEKEKYIVDKYIAKYFAILKIGEYLPEIRQMRCENCNVLVSIPDIVITWECPVCNNLLYGYNERVKVFV